VIKEAVEASSISKILGITPTLPGEPEHQYQSSLRALIDELDAKTVLQVYLAEKIHDCIWWIQRYENQKRATIIAEMAALTNGHYTNNVTSTQAHIRDALMQNKIDQKSQEIMQAVGHTAESLRQKAFEKKRLLLNN